ncbi:MAG: aminotransferase class V-fold PLP-dependent enzyme [Chloroflexi bacterium]|nr:aminotransferase class V-fold PLP-dependent enzyme [Chloroflexota bacterium]
MDIARIREAIPVTRNLVYMNTGWSGPSPQRVTQRINDQLAYEMERGPATLDALPRSRAVHEELSRAVAGLLHAPEESIALTQSTTHGLVTVVNGLDWRAGDEVVTCSLEHPSVLLPSLLLQKSHGVRVRIADLDPQDDKATLLSKLEAQLSPRTRLVFLSHIQFSNGLRLPAREVAQMAHRRGAFLLLDGAQCAGQIALDMGEMDCDFYAMPGHKWLMGPDGTGALYLRPELIPQVAPRYPAHGAVESWDVATGAVTLQTASPRKFRLSTTSTALEAGMAEAIAFQQELGSHEIEARAMALAARLMRTLKSIPGLRLTCPEDPELGSALVTFAVAGKEPRQVVEMLWGRGIAARQVPTPPAVRLCTAFFNTEEEVERVGAVLAELAGSA